MIRKVELDQVRSDHLAHRVGVDEASEEDERHEMVVEDFGVEVQV